MKNSFKTSPAFFYGVTSLAGVLLILVFAAFAVLSLATASGDYSLTKKAAASLSSYYEACNKAETALSYIADAVQKTGGTARLRGKGYEVEEKGNTIIVTYTIDIDGGRFLKCQAAADTKCGEIIFGKRQTCVVGR